MNIKEDFFSDLLLKDSFFLLIKPEDNIYLNTSIRNSFFEELGSLVKLGLKNIEISWSNNEKWLDFVSEIKLNFPQINLGSASIVNKQSIEDSLKIGLNFSMMKFWDKDLFNYSKSKNYLLIPGINNLKDLKEAIDLNCNIIKIYPIKSKDSSINIFSQIALIILIGISTKNSILIVDYTNQIRTTGAKIEEALMEACKLRIRPIIMTSLSTMIAMLPLIVGNIGPGAGEASRLAVGSTIFGGMIISTFFTLYVTPTMYLTLAKNTKRIDAVDLELEKQLIKK